MDDDKVKLDAENQVSATERDDKNADNAVSANAPDENNAGNAVSMPVPPDDETLSGEVDDGFNNEFARSVNALSVEAWRKIQIIVGGILGLASGACLFLIKSDPNSFLPMNFLLALFIALVTPNIAEKQLQRKVDVGRTALLIALAFVIVVYLIYGLATGVFNT